MSELWKENWDDAKNHFRDWWDHKGLVVACQGAACACLPREGGCPPPSPANAEDRYLNPEWVSKHRRHELSRQRFLLDTLPVMPGETYMHLLSHVLGATPVFEEHTIWNKPCIIDPETHPPLRFDPENKWWKRYVAVMRDEINASEGRYCVGLPLLMNDLDVLFDLRGEELLTDLIDRPEWISRKLAEIDSAYKEAYQSLYEMAHLPDGSCIDEVLSLWGPGRTALIQSDVAAMLSPQMFSELVAPHIEDLASWLDYALFHLDGPNMLCHLDRILAMDGIGAIQWMAGAGEPGHGDAKWHPLYRRILKAGKSVQILWISVDETAPLLDAIGTDGVYILVDNVNSASDLEKLMRIVDKYR